MRRSRIGENPIEYPYSKQSNNWTVAAIYDRDWLFGGEPITPFAKADLRLLGFQAFAFLEAAFFNHFLVSRERHARILKAASPAVSLA